MTVAERIELIRELCSFEGRWPGTDSERRAGNHLAARLKGMGRRARVEPTFVHPEYPLVHALHVVVAIAGSVVSVYVSWLGFALVLLAAVSMFGDLSTRFYLARRLFFRRASQNVVSPGRRPEAPARLILTAHYDVAKTGLVFGEKWLRRGAKLDRRLPFTLGPFLPLFWSIAILLPILGARMAGVEATALSVAQLVPTIALMVAVPLLLDISLSSPVPGANDNASGVATALSLAGELDRDPPTSLDVWVVLTGAEECLMEGMSSFVKEHRNELEPESTYFVNIDTVGHGTVRYLTAEGFVVLYGFDTRLIQLCEAIAEADREAQDRFGAEPQRSRFGTDGLPPRLAGYPAITIGCAGELNLIPNYHRPTDTPDRIDPVALERAHGFVLELVRQIDRDVGRRLELDKAA